MKFLHFQVWQPSSVNSLVYHKVGEVKLKKEQLTEEKGNIFIVHINLTSNDTIEFQSEDVVGFYHPPNSRYRVMHIKTDGYLLYKFSGSLPSNSVNISEAIRIEHMQPLIEFTVGMKIFV